MWEQYSVDTILYGGRVMGPDWMAKIWRGGGGVGLILLAGVTLMVLYN